MNGLLPFSILEAKPQIHRDSHRQDTDGILRHPKRLNNSWDRVRIESARDAHRADAGKIRGDGVDVAQIHGQRVVALVADRERRRRGDRRGDHVHLRERFFEVAFDKRANREGLEIASYSKMLRS